MVKYFGKLAPICAGGATTMDTTLPIITKFSGSEYVMVALFHGIIIDFSVPLWVSFFSHYKNEQFLNKIKNTKTFSSQLCF